MIPCEEVDFLVAVVSYAEGLKGQCAGNGVVDFQRETCFLSNWLNVDQGVSSEGTFSDVVVGSRTAFLGGTDGCDFRACFYCLECQVDHSKLVEWIVTTISSSSPSVENVVFFVS